MPPLLDHIIVLIEYEELISPPSWITDNFTLTPGGRHGDNKTENKLICFQDGSYIELISFIDNSKAHRSGHWWGDREYGVIDFAFTHSDGSSASHFSELSSRLDRLHVDQEKDRNVKVEYASPQEGARLRPDGKEVKWEVTFPVVDTGYKRGELPFFCHDVTDRSLRVPGEKKNVEHPCGAYGLLEMSIFVPEDRLGGLKKAYAAILDTKEIGNEVGEFEVGSVCEDEGVGGLKIFLKSAEEQWQAEEVNRRGGVLIGDMVIGGGVECSNTEEALPKKRIDVEKQDGGMEMGRISLLMGISKV